MRASLATTLGDLGRERAQAPLTTMLNDSDQRVIPSVLDALAKIGATNAAEVLMARLKADDPVVRGAAARGLATIKAPNAAAALTEAFKTGQRDGLYVARTSALDALTALDPAAARPLLTSALGRSRLGGARARRRESSQARSRRRRLGDAAGAAAERAGARRASTR